MKSPVEAFIDARRGWLEVEAVDRPDGWWDIVVRIDGAYSPDERRKERMVAYFSEWLAAALDGVHLFPHMADEGVS